MDVKRDRGKDRRRAGSHQGVERSQEVSIQSKIVCILNHLQSIQLIEQNGLFYTHRAAKEAQHAAKAARKAEEAAAKEASDRIDDVNFLSINDTYEPYGDLTRVMSRSRTGRQFSFVKDLPKKTAGDKVWLRGRLQSIRVKGGSCFLVLRQDSFHTVQACYFKDK